MNNLIMDCNIVREIALNRKNGKFPHAYLFISEDMETLKDVARSVCEILFKEDYKISDNISMRIEKGIYPDVIEKGYDKFPTTGDIEGIINDVYICPFESEKKVYVLYNVDEMNDSASNKLLKTLEEPPKNVFFILCAKNEFALLQTIKSRCEKLYLERFKSPILVKELINMGADENIAEIASSISMGLLSKAKKAILDKDYIQLINLVKKTYYELNSSRDLVILIDLYASRRDDFNVILDIFSCLTRDFLMYQIGEKDLVDGKSNYEMFENLKTKYSIKVLLKILEKIIALKQKISYNINVLEIIDEFLFYFVEVKVKCKE